MKNGIFAKSVSTLAMASLIISATAAYVPAYAGENETTVKADDVNVISDTELGRRQDKLTKTLLASADTTDSDKVDKDETVYVFSDAAGTQNKIIVSDWLKNPDGADTLTDSSNLSDIKNVKGDETFTQDGDTVTWAAKGSDIYYQGTTTEESPIGVKVSYKLDGKDIEPSELAGKSGKVTIRFDYTNNAKQKVKIGDKDSEVSVPFTVITGMILPEDKFTNVEVTNGKVISEGKNATAIGVTFPGLKDSLELDDDTDVPDYFEVTADATDFELEMTLTCALPDVVSDAVDTKSGKFNDLKDMLHDLTDGKDELSDGVNDLKDGTSELKDKSADLKDGVDKLDDGASDLKDGAKDLKDGVKKVNDGANDLNDGAKKVKDGTKSVKDGADSLKTGADSLKTGADSLNTGLGKISTGAASLSDGLSQASSGAAVLAKSTSSIGTSAQSLADGAAQVDKGVQTLAGTINTIGTSIGTQVSTLDSQIADYQGKMSQLLQAYGSAEVMAAKDPSNFAKYNQMAGAVAALQQVEEGLKSQAASLASPESAQSLQALVKGADDLSAGASKFATAVQALPTSTQSLADALDKLYQGSLSLKSGADSAAEGAGKLSAGAGELSTGAGKLSTGANTLYTGTKDLANGTKTLADGTKSLYDGSDKLYKGTKDLKSGTNDLSDGTDKLIDGIGKLDDGAGDLKDGVDKLVDKLSDKDSTDILDRIDAVMDAGKDYDIFTGLASGQSGTVKFIIKTDAIKIETAD
ncbi:MAG: hypothetical protein SPL99_02035 [Catonella sp.]|nr:hypothetical protein [Catonella sp.]MDY6356855.1 hypothetical protein [Catonella sp.]